MRERIRAVNLALLATLILSAVKLVTAFMTGSVSVLSEAIHSGLDLISSILTRIVVGVSDKPADEGRPFGYGKLETLSALFESVLLLVAGVYILFESASSFRHGTEIENVGIAIIVTTASMVINLFIYFQNRNVGRAHESLAIETNAYHFLTDFFTSAALLLGLVVIRYTGWVILDPIAAGLISVYIFWVAVAQLRKCIDELSDVALSDKEVEAIEASIKANQSGFINFHDLRTRRVGKKRHVEMHLTVCSEFKVKAAHDLCDRIEADIQEKFPESHVTIHIEPCDHHQTGCSVLCEDPFKEPPK